MEWISFVLTSSKKEQFEKEILPGLTKRHGFLLDMSDLTWAARYEQKGLDNYRCLFCSDSPLFLKFVKDFAEGYQRVYSTPDLTNFAYFGPEDVAG